jgi:hypothetical protein
MKNEHLKLIIPVVILLVTLAVFNQRRLRKRATENYHQFYNAEIIGRIETKVSASKGSSRFQVNGKEYSFSPYTSDLNDNSIFEHTAEPGDSIFKEQRQDTLLVIKPAKILKYTFYKFEK